MVNALTLESHYSEKLHLIDSSPISTLRESLGLFFTKNGFSSHRSYL